jgi:DnaJ-class molecular chaperone
MEEEKCEIHGVRKVRTDCYRCDGDGEIEADDDIFSFRPGMETCYQCRGSGLTSWTVCEICEDLAREEENP